MVFYTDLPQDPLGESVNVLLGSRYEQAPAMPVAYALDTSKIPETFPLQAWFDQSRRYIHYWNWFNGDALASTKKGEDGETLYKYPLHMNLLRDMTRKHANLLFGEAPDSDTPLVKCQIRPRKGLDGTEPSDKERKFATSCQNLINEVWNQSNGRAIQLEGGELSQFLGGHFYQIAYDPFNPDLYIPFVIRSWNADFVLPVWEHKNFWDLSQIWIVQRIDSQIAKNNYKIETNGAFAMYVELWTKNTHEIYIDRKPVTMSYGDGVTITYDKNNKNPFGFVPFVYIPHLREGTFYGNSHVPDVQGIIREYNNSMASLGDGVIGSVDRERYVVNVGQKVNRLELPNGKEAVNLGIQAPTMQNPPDLFTEDPPTFSAGLVDYPTQVFNQFRRTACLPPVIDGEDEGSQRSGLTLDIRFYPATSHAKSERVYWESGLNQIAKYILRMLNVKGLWDKAGIPTPKQDFMRSLTFSQEWFPQIPRDREAEINEVIARLGANAIDIDTALEKLGDIPNIEATKKLILEWVGKLTKIQAENKPQRNKPLSETNLNRNQKNTDAS